MTAAPGLDSPAALPVIFTGGGREIDLGWVAVGRELRPRKLRSLVGQAVGVPARQISLSLVGPNGHGAAPLDDGLDLAAAVGGGSFLLAALAAAPHPPPPRRSRKGRTRRIRVDGRSAEPPGKAILKRQPREDDARAEGEEGCEVWCSAYQHVAAEDGKRGVCKVCEAVGLPLPAFHWCAYDAVTVGFRSRVGPIQRPTKA